VYPFLSVNADSQEDLTVFGGLCGVTSIHFDVSVNFKSHSHKARLSFAITGFPPSDETTRLLSWLCLTRTVLHLQGKDSLAGYETVVAQLVFYNELSVTWTNPADATQTQLLATHGNLGRQQRRLSMARPGCTEAARDLADLERVISLVTSAPNWRN
jgi:hypothetical protein